MIEELQQFGSLSVAHRTGGARVELMRSKNEVVFLAFDTRIARLVELHVLRGGHALDVAMKKSALERARQASQIRGHAFMRILEVSEDQGLVYYTSNLNDGEFVEAYVKRRGAVAPATALALVYQLLDELLQLQGYQRLASRMHLDQVLVTTLEDTFLQLRVFDYGLAQMDADTEEQAGARLMVEACRLIFLLLTGQPYAGENPDRFPALTQLPMGLRTAIRAALTDPVNAPACIEKLRDDVREAFSALSSNIKARNFRKHLVVNASLLPQSQLQELLLENVPVETILGTRFRVADAESSRCYPFSIPAINTKISQEITVHLLPPSRIVDKTRYEAVPLQMWRFNPERHPNILRSLSLWESPDWTFLTEEREPGFALSRLMAERITLNPAEVIVLMRQIRAGLDQAVECGVQRVDLHPSNILLRVGKNGPLLARELERLMQKRLDAWPHFVVKLRPHMTMRSLYEPLLVDMDLAEGQQQEEHLLNRDFRHRSFVALAGYLLTGERQSGGAPQFPESVPDAAAAYMRDCLELTRRAGKTPSPGDFIDKFESLLSAPTVDLATRLRGSSVALEEMESAGAVSDFDDDWNANEAGASLEDGEVVSPIKCSIKIHDFNPLMAPKSSLPWGAIAAAAAVVIGLAAWMLIGGKDEPARAAQTAVTSAVPEGPALMPKSEPKVAAVSKSETQAPKSQPPAPQKMQTPAAVAAVVPSAPAKPAPAMAEVVPNPSVATAMAAQKTPSTPLKPQAVPAMAVALPNPSVATTAVVEQVTSSAPVKPQAASAPKTEAVPQVKPVPALAVALPNPSVTTSAAVEQVTSSAPVKPQAATPPKTASAPQVKPAPAIVVALPNPSVTTKAMVEQVTSSAPVKPQAVPAPKTVSAPQVKPVPAMAVALPNPPVTTTAMVEQVASSAPVKPQAAPVPMTASAPQVKPVPEKPAATVAVVTAVTPADPQPVQPVASESPEKAPITIRRAILPSREEIDRIKQAQVGHRTGQMSAMSTAAPMAAKR